MQSALKRHDALLRVAVESANGRVVLTTGDAILAVFDSVQDGVRAGLEAQGDLLDEPWGETGTLSVRGCTLERRSRAAGFEQVELLDARFLAIGFVWARKPAVVG
jgi:class 3 adenylate cyclase